MVSIINKKSLFILSMMACSTSYAASFDCNKATSDVEKMICSDHKLSRLDDYLSQNYKIAMGPDMPEGSKSKIRKSQIDWIDKRNTCTDTKCIEKMYSKQMDYLWNECFDHLSGKIEYIKFYEAMDIIKKEENSVSNSKIIREKLMKNVDKIQLLGFTEKQLNADVYIDIGGHVKYSRLRDYLALMYELPEFKSLDKVKYKNYVGFRIKVSGQPYSGFILREDDGEFYLVGLISGDEVIESVTLQDIRSLSSIFMSYASVAKNNMGIKY